MEDVEIKAKAKAILRPAPLNLVLQLSNRLGYSGSVFKFKTLEYTPERKYPGVVERKPKRLHSSSR